VGIGSWFQENIVDPVVDTVQDVGDWINDEIVDPITDVVSDIPIVGDVTDAIEDVWKEDVRPWASEALTAVGTAIGGPIGGAIGGAAGQIIEGGNSDEILASGIQGGIQGYVGQLTGTSGTGVDFSGKSASEVLGGLWDSAVKGMTNVGTIAKDFLSAPIETIKEAIPSLGELGELGETAVEKLKAELGRLPQNAANTVVDMLKGGGDAAQKVIDGVTSGKGLEELDWGNIVNTAGTAYAGEKAAEIQAEAINNATEARLTAARESMDLQRELTREGLGLQRELAERGFGFQERGLRLGGAYREAGTGALNELSQLYGLGGLSNAVDPYTGKPIEGSPQGAQGVLGRQQAQQAAMDRFKASPGYQFRQSEGLKAIDRLASARGYMGSTRAAREAQRYGEGLASQEYGDYVRRLSNMAGMGGQQIGTGVSALGGSANLAGNLGASQGATLSNLGANLGTTAMGMGDARASGYISGGAYGASNWANRGNLWQELF